MIYILAEMAASHEGKIETAQMIIESAARAKADGILFQIIDLKSYIVPDDIDYEDVRSFNMSFDNWKELIERAGFLGLDVWANVYDLKSAQFLKDKNIKGFKLHSSNLENEDLIKEVVSQNKDILLSIGGMSEDEIKKVLGNNKMVLMYGLQNFPTNPEDINLNFISDLSKELNLKWGYQDHSEPESSASTYLPIIAIAKGARVIEKHITNNRSLRGQDYESALNPDEFVQFVKDIRDADKIISKNPDEVSGGELKYKKYKTLMKVVAKKDITIGDQFSKDNIAAMRCKIGEIPATDLEKLIKNKSKNNYKKFSPIFKTEL